MKPKRRLKKKVKEFLCLMLCSSLLIFLAVLTIRSILEEKDKEHEVLVYSNRTDSIEQEITPKAAGQLVVVVDPACGGTDTGMTTKEGYTEKDFTFQVAGVLQEKIPESNIKVYFTRVEDVEVSEEERITLVQETDADLYVRLAVSADEDASQYGIQGYYNEKYVIPDFGNVQWADVVMRKVTSAASNKAVSLENVAEDSILNRLKIPAVQVNLGFFTNPQEALLMQQEEYQRKLAQGIADAIFEVYNKKRQGKGK